MLTLCSKLNPREEVAMNRTGSRLRKVQFSCKIS